jgi:hypothetical protein
MRKDLVEFEVNDKLEIVSGKNQKQVISNDDQHNRFTNPRSE